MGRLDDAVDMVELRLDFSGREVDLRGLRAATGLPIIATNRSTGEGGLWRGSEEERLRLLVSALEAGAEYADIESSADVAKLVGEARECGAKVIASRHYQLGVPTLREMETLLWGAKTAGASLIKVVGTASSYVDGVACLEFLRANPGNVCFAMGLHGVPSRVLSSLVGGAFTYASAAEGEEVAPGQLTARKMREIYALMGVDG